VHQGIISAHSHEPNVLLTPAKLEQYARQSGITFFLEFVFALLKSLAATTSSYCCSEGDRRINY
jgi:hypothetical protein